MIAGNPPEIRALYLSTVTATPKCSACEPERWVEPAHDPMQWQDLISGLLNIRFLLSDGQLVQQAN
jgi:hypothetical protein